MNEKIYLDNNATTKIDPKVLSAMLKELEGPPGNASSIHAFGQRAKKILQKSREVIASYFGCQFDEVIFTSGGTESLNMCINGLLNKKRKGKILSTSLEHAAVYNSLLALKKEGYSPEFLFSHEGSISPLQLEKAIDDETDLVVLSSANSETGILSDIESIAKVTQQAHIPLIIDGVAILGKEKIPSLPKGITAICFSGHKIHAPKGIGLVILRDTYPFTPLLYGGHQEFDKRAGTENLAAIIGLKTAIELLLEDPSLIEKIRTLRDYFEGKLIKALPGCIIHGKDKKRISNTSSISFFPVPADHLLLLLDQKGVAASHGSACSSGSLEPSRVLLNMGIERKIVQSSIRFSFSRYNTIEEIERTIEILTKAFTDFQS